MTLFTPVPRLDELSREELLHTVRRLLAETEALSSRIAAVNEIGIAISRTRDLDEILRVIAKQAKWLLDFEHCSVCLRDIKHVWKMVTLFGAPLENVTASDTDSSDLGFVLRTGQSRLINKTNESTMFSQFGSKIIIALVSEGSMIGAIIFARSPESAYAQDDLRVGYLLALQLAAAIRNAEHFEELKLAEDELRRYTVELEARNAELDAFSHTIAHDLKTPLSTIVLKTDLVRRVAQDTLSVKAQSYLDDTKAAALNMAQMIDQLLWLARLRNATETATQVDVNASVQAALDRFETAVAAAGIIVQIDDLPKSLGHAQWIEEVFANLIGNAIKYMGKDNPHKFIHIRGEHLGSMVRYEVQDSGIGIAPIDQIHLFEMFTRLHMVNAEGLGLGLSIVHRIINRLKGTIGVESVLGEGSTFWFTLPSV